MYHSLLCVILQFLILRLMGRTVTAVLTTFCFQMVSIFPVAAQVTAEDWGEVRDCGVEKPVNWKTIQFLIVFSQ